MNFLTVTIFWIFAGTFFISDVVSRCCPHKERVAFNLKPDVNCNNITGAMENIFGVCVYETCPDLLDHRDKKFCGKGECNVFGCNCDNGCIQLDQWGKNQVSILKEIRGHAAPIYLRDILFEKFKPLVESINMGHSYQSKIKLYKDKRIGW